MTKQEIYEIAMERERMDTRCGVPQEARQWMLNIWLTDLLQHEVVPAEIVNAVRDRLIFERVLHDYLHADVSIWIGDHMPTTDPETVGWKRVADGSLLTIG